VHPANHPQHSPRPRPVHHAGACSERIPSPHERCQEWADPYNAAEVIDRRSTSMGPVRVVIYVCHGCNATWQESRATA
jgi:hypothetical protein